jgi:ABC-type branched-subunit amino acid transport system ATPase component
MNTMPINYREEIVKKVFEYIKSGESFYLIGAPSAGKTRLLDFLMGDDPDARRSGVKVDRKRVKKQYLNTEADNVWLIRVDMNRLHQDLDVSWKFQFYELLLNSILLVSTRYHETEIGEKIFDELSELDSQALTSKDALTAHRLLEIFISRMCHKYNIKLCFLFDEFDDTYRNIMPLDVFAQLRAIRDANKYFVSYGLFLRALPESLRPPAKNEGFFELISSRMIGVGLYSKRDMLSIIDQWEKRHEQSLSASQREWLWEHSGGHPGLARALFGLLTESSQAVSKLDNLEWFARQETVREEMRKIWEGLSKEEQTALQQIKRQNEKSIPLSIGKQLHAKGLIRFVKSNLTFFSPLFAHSLK